MSSRPAQAGSRGAGSLSWPAAVMMGSEVPSVLFTGFMLIGSDVKLNSPSSLVGQALTEVLQHPERARDALRVLLHLVRGWGALTQAPMEKPLDMHEKGEAEWFP